MAVGLLEVNLVSARGLGETHLFSRMDPYVVIEYKGQERKSSVAREQGSSPEWNEKFTFRAEYTGSGGDYKITLKIMDKDTFTSDDFIGQATIYVKDLMALGVQNGTAEQHPLYYSVVRANNTYHGEIKVGLTFTPQVEQDDGEQSFGGWKNSATYPQRNNTSADGDALQSRV